MDERSTDRCLGPVEVLIIGGGPAGSTAARVLALWGHRVALVTGPEPRSSLAESLPPSIRRLFRALDILHSVDAAGFYRSTGNTVWWGGTDARVEFFPPHPQEFGYQVLRRDFDRLLLARAVAAGVTVIKPAAVRTVDLDDPEQAVIWMDAPEGKTRAAGRFVLDCSGRVGVIARGRYRRKEPGQHTVALSAVWSRPGGWPVPDPTHTIVESYRDGWAWSVPVSATERHVTMMIDRAESEWTRGAGLDAAYRHELAKTVHFNRLFPPGDVHTAPWSIDASLYFSDVYAGSNVLLVGDAGSFIDPLSSVGVKKAMASAWLAAVAVHTCLTNSSMHAVALDYFESRERTIYRASVEQQARFGALANQAHGHPFWLTRSEAGDALDPGFDGEDLLRDPQVRATYEDLRQRDEVRLIASNQVRLKNMPAVKGNEVILEDALDIRGLSRTIRYLRNVDLVALLGVAREGGSVPDLFETYHRAMPVPLPDFLTGVAFLARWGLLVHADPGDRG